jgi:hypothetical protein
MLFPGGAVAQLGARLDGIEEVVGSNPIGSTKIHMAFFSIFCKANLLAAFTLVRRNVFPSASPITTLDTPNH